MNRFSNNSGNIKESYGIDTTSDSQCNRDWGDGGCEADSGYNPDTCVEYAGRCYSKTARQCTRDSQCGVSWTGECIKSGGGSSLYCRHDGAYGSCVCTKDKTTITNISNTSVVTDQIRNLADYPDIAALMFSFALSSRRGPWIGSDFSKVKIINDMIVRLEKPWKVDQTNTPFCGCAAIVVCLLTKDPIRYINIMRQLWEYGYFYTAKSRTRITASRSILTDSEDRVPIPAVDWMIQAVLRDNEQILFRLDPSDRGLELNVVGITTPWEITSWMEELFNYSSRNVDFDWTITGGDLDGLRAGADNLNRAGGITVMLVSYEGLIEGKEVTFPIPQHWIVLFNDSITISNGHVKFNVYNYGKIQQIDAKESHFKSYVFGFGTGHS